MWLPPFSRVLELATAPVLALALALACFGGASHAALPDGQIWLDHAQRDLLPWWRMAEAQGQAPGRFPTFRCNDGSAFKAEAACPELANGPAWVRPELGRDYVRMQSQQIFTYAMGFHLTGDPKLLELARAGARDLRQRVFNLKSGGVASWSDGTKAEPEVDRRGTQGVAQDCAQAAVGLAALYYLTNDSGLLGDLIKLKAHIASLAPEAAGGQVGAAGEVGEVGGMGNGAARRAAFDALLGQINAYLVLVTPSLPEGQLKRDWHQDIANLSKLLVDRYHDAAGGRFLGASVDGAAGGKGGEGGTGDSTPGRGNDFGRSVNAYRMLYLGARLNRDDALAAFGRDGMRRSLEQAWNDGGGSWSTILKPDGTLDGGKEWWVYAELDQAQALLAVEQGDPPLRLERAWPFWLERMVDRQHGEVWDRVGADGVVVPGALKQHPWKNGMHSMGHALAGYIAGQALAKKTATLYFALPSTRNRRELRPYTFNGRMLNESVSQVGGVTVQKVEFEIVSGSNQRGWHARRVAPKAVALPIATPTAKPAVKAAAKGGRAKAGQRPPAKQGRAKKRR